MVLALAYPPIGTTRRDLVQSHVLGTIPPAPLGREDWKPPRQPGGRARHVLGVPLRFATVKASKIITSIAPARPCPTTAPACPVHFYHSRHQLSYQPSMNIPYLRANVIPVVRATGDHNYADYLDQCYRHGFFTGADIPVDATRLTAPNKAIPGTSRGQPISDMLLRMRASGRLHSSDRPLPGTVVLPVGSCWAIKFSGTDLKVKIRDTVDSKSPRKHRTSPGHWDDPQYRNFACDTIFQTLAIIAEVDAEAFGAQDFEAAYNTLTLNPASVVRQAILWSLPGEPLAWHYPSCGLFGGTDTPYNWHLHCHGLTLLISKEIDAAIAAVSPPISPSAPPVHIPIARATDDLLFIYPRGTSKFHLTVTATTRRVTQDARCPRSEPKEVVISDRIRFQGFIIVADRFPNPLGITSAGIGFDVQRAVKIRIACASAISGLDRAGSDSFLGLASWVTPVLPHSRGLLEAYRAGLKLTPLDQRYVPDAPARKDIQRFMGLFSSELIVPIYMILCLGEPRRTIWTDASGAPTADGNVPYFGGYDDSPTAPWFYSIPVPPELWIAPGASKFEVENSTMYLELVALFILLWTSVDRRYYGRRRHGFAIRWYSDSQAGVNAWRRQSSRRPYCNHLIKHIGFLCSRSGIYVEALFVPREENVAADALTHHSIAQFTSLTDIPPSRERDPGPTPLSEVLSLRSPSV